MVNKLKKVIAKSRLIFSFVLWEQKQACQMERTSNSVINVDPYNRINSFIRMTVTLEAQDSFDINEPH